MSGTIDWNAEDALIFNQVVEAGSFTGAARILELPKSTVSRRVSRLEDVLGVQLLRRTTRQLNMTDAGRAFYARAAEAAEALVAAECAATSMLDVPRGRLRVTAPLELGTRMFRVLLAFSEAYPEVHLDLDLTSRFVNLVEEGYDVALRGGRAPEGALTGRSLGVDELHVMASPEYLARRGTPRRSRDLAKHDCILFPNWISNSAWTLTSARGTTRVPIRGRLTLNNLDAVRLATLQGLGLALLPQSHCESNVRDGALKRVLPRLCMTGAGLWVVYSRTRFLSAKVRAFRDTLLTEYTASAPSTGG
jgi:DNA-binding transcriptional LysR family regulator